MRIEVNVNVDFLLQFSSEATSIKVRLQEFNGTSYVNVSNTTLTPLHQEITLDKSGSDFTKNFDKTLIKRLSIWDTYKFVVTEALDASSNSLTDIVGKSIFIVPRNQFQENINANIII